MASNTKADLSRQDDKGLVLVAELDLHFDPHVGHTDGDLLLELRGHLGGYLALIHHCFSERGGCTPPESGPKLSLNLIDENVTW